MLCLQRLPAHIQEQDVLQTTLQPRPPTPPPEAERLLLVHGESARASESVPPRKNARNTRANVQRVRQKVRVPLRSDTASEDLSHGREAVYV